MPKLNLNRVSMPRQDPKVRGKTLVPARIATGTIKYRKTDNQKLSSCVIYIEGSFLLGICER
jgi:hypothetical protein